LTRVTTRSHARVLNWAAPRASFAIMYSVGSSETGRAGAHTSTTNVLRSCPALSLHTHLASGTSTKMVSASRIMFAVSSAPLAHWW
jgi:hypothetical protein